MTLYAVTSIIAWTVVAVLAVWIIRRTMRQQRAERVRTIRELEQVIRADLDAGRNPIHNPRYQALGDSLERR